MLSEPVGHLVYSFGLDLKNLKLSEIGKNSVKASETQEKSVKDGMLGGGGKLQESLDSEKEDANEFTRIETVLIRKCFVDQAGSISELKNIYGLSLSKSEKDQK